MKTILIVDHTPILRDTISLSLRLEGYRTVTATNAKEAMAHLGEQPVSLILLDLGIPASESVGILAAVRAGAKTRNLAVILFASVDDRQKVAQAAKLGFVDYLMKPAFSLADLTETIRRKLTDSAAGSDAANSAMAAHTQADARVELPSAPGSQTPESSVAGSSRIVIPVPAPIYINTPTVIPQLLKRDACIARATEAMEGRTLSGAVAQVIAMAMSPDMDVNQLAILIGRDPILSAKVLRVANSAIYASRGGPKTTIAEAVRNIGANTVRNLAAMTGIFEAMPETAPDGFNPIRCWQHSFAVARLTEHFSSFEQPENGGIAYMVGLCHDLVEIVFHAQFASEYAQILEWEARTGRPRRDLEKAMLGIEQSDLVVTILKQLGLPETIHGPIEAFHRGSSARRSDAIGRMARVLRLAEFHANGLLLASGAQSVVSPITAVDCKAATGQENPAMPDGELLRNEVMAMAAMLARFSAPEEAKLVSPLYPPSDRRVCLVRAASFSSCDPIESVLASIARVTVVDQIPLLEQLRGFETLVISVPSTSAIGLGQTDFDRIKARCIETGVNLICLVRSIEALNSAPGVQLLRWPTTLAQLAAAIGISPRHRPDAAGRSARSGTTRAARPAHHQGPGRTAQVQ
jgi:HD-like signal output (HDOD) protein/DNA-binding NarL/FixJ family response regulator